MYSLSKLDEVTDYRPSLPYDMLERLPQRSENLKLLHQIHSGVKTENEKADVLESVEDEEEGEEGRKDAEGEGKSSGGDFGSPSTSPSKKVSALSVDELRETVNGLLDTQICQVCMDAKVSTAFCPCGHIVCCVACSTLCRECPLCRVQITYAQRIFFSGI